LNNTGVPEKYIKFIFDSLNENSFAQELGVLINEIGHGYVLHQILLEDKHTNPYKAIHGGVVVSLADIAMGNAIRSLGIKVVTLDLATSFISTAYKNDQLNIRAEVLRSGQSVIYAEAKIWVNDTLISNATGTFLKIGEV